MLYAQLQDAAPPGPTDPRSIANADFALSGPGAGPGADGGETRGLKQLTTARGYTNTWSARRRCSVTGGRHEAGVLDA